MKISDISKSFQGEDNREDADNGRESHLSVPSSSATRSSFVINSPRPSAGLSRSGTGKSSRPRFPVEVFKSYNKICLTCCVTCPGDLNNVFPCFFLWFTNPWSCILLVMVFLKSSLWRSSIETPRDWKCLTSVINQNYFSWRSNSSIMWTCLTSILHLVLFSVIANRL